MTFLVCPHFDLLAFLDLYDCHVLLVLSPFFCQSLNWLNCDVEFKLFIIAHFRMCTSNFLKSAFSYSMLED